MKFLSWALEGAELLQPLLVMSLQGAVLIGAVWRCGLSLPRRMAPGVLYALWLLPAARLLIPGSIGSAFSFLNFIPKEMEAQAMAAAVMQTAVVQTPLDIPMTAVGPGLTVPVAGSGSSAPMTGLVVFNLAAILMLVWLLGMAACCCMRCGKTVRSGAELWPGRCAWRWKRVRCRCICAKIYPLPACAACCGR